MQRILPFLTLLLTVGAADADAQPHQAGFSFGVLADVQYCDCDSRGSRYYRSSLGKLAEAVAVYNEEQPDFVVQVGDLVDRDAESFDAVLPLIRSIEVPTHHVLGNHEFSLESIPPGERRSFVMKTLGLEHGYYDFRHKGWRFVMLDGNDVSVYATAPETETRSQAEKTLAALKETEAANAQPWNGALGERQLQWLDRTLAEADLAGERAVVFCHFPVFPDDAHNLWNAETLLALLERHPSVAAYVSGHNHAGGYAQHDGIHFLTLKGMVETAGTTAFAIIDVTPDALHVGGWGREPDRILHLSPRDD